VVEKPVEKFERLWSDKNNWPNQTLPKENEDVEIPSGWNMTMDLPTTPLFKLVQINGILNFKQDIDIHFRAMHIFVRAGELNVGSEKNPYMKNCTIEMVGDYASRAIVYDNAIEAGNKIIANINKVRMYGKKRTKNMSRLMKPAMAGDTIMQIEKGLDLVPGDRIAFLPTSFGPEDSDDCHVLAYDKASGNVKISRERPAYDGRPGLLSYHFGAEKSTAGDFDGVDMRGEVVILSRNIRVIGGDHMINKLYKTVKEEKVVDGKKTTVEKEVLFETRRVDTTDWGCQLVTSDTLEFNRDGTVMSARHGQTILDNVEFFRCS
jgi:hypothetical protein